MGDAALLLLRATQPFFEVQDFVVVVVVYLLCFILFTQGEKPRDIILTGKGIVETQRN